MKNLQVDIEHILNDERGNMPAFHFPVKPDGKVDKAKLHQLRNKTAAAKVIKMLKDKYGFDPTAKS